MKAKKIGSLNLFLISYIFVSGFFALLFWFTGEESLIFYAKNLVEDGGLTKLNTGVFLLLSVLAILIYYYRVTHFRTIIRVISVFIFTLSTLTIAQYLFGVDFRIDTLFIEDQLSNTNPGRMTILTAVSFIIFTLGLYSLVTRKTIITNIAQSIFFVLPLFALLNVITIILKLTVGWDKIPYLTSISLEAPFSFLVLSYLLVMLFPFEGYKGVILSKNIGSNFLRKSLPFIVLLPLIMAFLVLQYIDKNFISAEFGIILFTFTLISVLIITQYGIAENVNKSYKEKLQMQNDLLVRNKELALFKYALDQIAVVAIMDDKFTFKMVNDNFCELTKFKRGEILGKTNSVIQSDEHPKAFFDDIWTTVSQGKTWIGEIKNRAADDTFFWTDTAIVPIKRGKRKKEFIIIKQDITKKKDREAYLASSHFKEIEEKNKELEQYIYLASHDLQEPLRTIASFSDILLMEYEDKFDDSAKQIFNYIQDAISRMTQLIKHLLDYSRLGQSEEPQTVDLNELARDLQSDLASLIDRKNAAVSVGDMPTLKAYPVAIRLLLQNLISNGMKFSKKDVPPEVNITCESMGDEWKFAVADNGIGIAKKHQQKIFRIFQRLHLKEEYEGTGIGLAHCKKIVSLHKGDMWVESELGKGSTFYFTIPKKLS